MKPGRVALERRRQYLVARIGAQRLQLEWRLDAFRGPLQAFQLARGLGETLRRNAKLAGAIAACALFILMRSALLPKALRTLQFAGTTTRWWVLARLGWHLVRWWRRERSLARLEVRQLGGKLMSHRIAVRVSPMAGQWTSRADLGRLGPSDT